MKKMGMRWLVGVVLFAWLSSAWADRLQDHFDAAWESLWYQGGAPLEVERWDQPLRVYVHGPGSSSEQARILKALASVAAEVGLQVEDVTSLPEAERRANVDVQLVEDRDVPDGLACSVRKDDRGGLIETAKVRMRRKIVYECVLHEAMHLMGIPGHPMGDTILSYFHGRVDTITELDRLILRAWYSKEMRPGMQPFAAFAVLTDAVVRADAGATRDAPARRDAFHAEVLRSMEAFAQGQGDVPRVLKRSGTASDATMQYARRVVPHFLGLSYLRGQFVPRDPGKALEWFRVGAQAGLGVSKYVVAEMLEKGLGGPADPAQAYVWYRLASAHKIADAEEAAKRLVTSLSLEQYAAAEERVAAYK